MNKVLGLGEKQNKVWAREILTSAENVPVPSKAMVLSQVETVATIWMETLSVAMVEGVWELLVSSEQPPK